MISVSCGAYAPTPKAFDGKPDLSGVWKNVGRGPGQPRETLGPNDIPFGTFFDIGQGFKDGLPLQPWAKELEAKRMADNGKDNPDA